MSDNHLVLVQNKLTSLLETKKQALPKDFNQTRFLQNCITVLQDTKDIDKVDPASVARTMLRGAFLGLDFFSRECYAIAYAGKIQFQTDFKGEIKLVKKYSINPIQDIYAKLVREGDVFDECIVAGQQTLNFKPIPFNNGKIIGAFAVVLYRDGSMQYEVMSAEEIDATRKNYSKQASGQAWTKSYGEMAKKTVLRRLCKFITISFESVEQQQQYYDSADVEFEKKEHKAKSSLDNIVEVEQTEGEAERGNTI